MTKHVKQPYKCTICNKEGHNSRTCKNINPDKETKTNSSISEKYIVGHNLFLLLQLVTTYEEAVQMSSEEENLYPIANDNYPFLACIFQILSKFLKIKASSIIIKVMIHLQQQHLLIKNCIISEAKNMNRCIHGIYSMIHSIFYTYLCSFFSMPL